MSEQEFLITEVDVLTGQVIQRSFTPEELAEYQVINAQEAARQEETQAKADAKASARAKLTALGLTEEEVAAL